MEQASNNESEQLLAGITQQFTAFLAQAATQPRSRMWLETESMQVYVRATERIIMGEVRHSLDIAAIEVAEEQQGKGLFSAFMRQAHRRNPYEVTYLEHAHSPIIEEWCIRNGWASDPGTSPVSFYALKISSEPTQEAPCDATPPSGSA